ncbi:hypothetical protein BOTCAL_0175g00130 [Botryotinia calthae]|uniref:Uncharacterized protein n=1 Tax=Botryotinia calthae TaxID=38488 RepID=A0A4Y8D0U1_9HELO|nr:hypothetical protein BOTCAL_0175g00130 [Botryotinia calthae]
MSVFVTAALSLSIRLSMLFKLQLRPNQQWLEKSKGSASAGTVPGLWTREQKDMIPKRFLGDAMCHLQNKNGWLRGAANLELEAGCFQDTNIATLGCFLVADEIDGGNA